MLFETKHEKFVQAWLLVVGLKHFFCLILELQQIFIIFGFGSVIASLYLFFS